MSIFKKQQKTANYIQENTGIQILQNLKMTAQKTAEAINLLYPRVKGPINSLEYKKRRWRMPKTMESRQHASLQIKSFPYGRNDFCILLYHKIWKESDFGRKNIKGRTPHGKHISGIRHAGKGGLRQAEAGERNYFTHRISVRASPEDFGKENLNMLR